MPPVGFSACSGPSNPKYYLWANLYGQMAIFTLSGPPFAPFRPYVGGEKKTPNGLPGCPLLCSSLVSYLSTQNRPSEPKCVAKSQFKPIWPTFWPPWGHNWDSWSGKWAKLVSLDILSAVSAWFQHCSIK